MHALGTEDEGGRGSQQLAYRPGLVKQGIICLPQQPAAADFARQSARGGGSGFAFDALCIIPRGKY